MKSGMQRRQLSVCLDCKHNTKQSKAKRKHEQKSTSKAQLWGVVSQQQYLCRGRRGDCGCVSGWDGGMDGVEKRKERGRKEVRKGREGKDGRERRRTKTEQKQ